ncbi:hypothetical protein V5799_014803 [Amblyomma americanum]|uniref:Uncharacterized protein n=1 Tax=Amblyomma americanum TaxID=6943 RepID=A0AAQ4E1Z4_AMBAM
MDAAREDADLTGTAKSSREKGKEAKEQRKERDTEAATATSKDKSKRGKKAASKKSLGALETMGLSHAVEVPLPETTAAEHIAIEASAANARRLHATQGTQASKAKRSKRRHNDGGDRSKGQGAATSSLASQLQPSAAVSPSLQPDVGGPQEARVPPEGQTTQSPVGIGNENPDDPRNFRHAADRRKSSAAALSQLIGEAELSGGVSGGILGQAAVAVSVKAASDAPDVHGTSLPSPSSARSAVTGARTQDLAETQISVLTDGTSIGASKSAISERDDLASRSARRRSTLLKQHSAITERALRDRRGSNMPAVRCTSGGLQAKVVPV